MDRRVRTTQKDCEGNIVALCNSGQEWSPRRTRDVLRDIRCGQKSYYVQTEQGRRYVRAVSGRLQTTADDADESLLSRLPTV